MYAGFDAAQQRPGLSLKEAVEEALGAIAAHRAAIDSATATADAQHAAFLNSLRIGDLELRRVMEATRKYVSALESLQQLVDGDSQEGRTLRTYKVGT